MKEIEKKLNSAVRNAGNVPSLLLDRIKERTALEPLEADEVKTAKVKRGVKYSFNILLSACATFVVCLFCFYAILIFFMPAGYQDPDNDASPGDTFPTYSVYDMEIVPFEVSSVKSFAEKNGMSLTYLDGECVFSKMNYEGYTLLYRSEYVYRGNPVTLTESVLPSAIREYETAIAGSESLLTLEYVYDDGDVITFYVYANDGGYLTKAFKRDGNILYIMSEGDISDTEALCRELFENSKNYK